jgi:hypothetical protein
MKRNDGLRCWRRDSVHAQCFWPQMSPVGRRASLRRMVELSNRAQTFLLRAAVCDAYHVNRCCKCAVLDDHFL